jgi:hypothetical protein
VDEKQQQPKSLSLHLILSSNNNNKITQERKFWRKTCRKIKEKYSHKKKRVKEIETLIKITRE